MRRSTHSTLRRIAGTAALVAATVVVPAGVAAAAEYPNGGNPPTQVPSSGSTVKASTTTNSSTLPFTGGDVAGLALIGAGAAIAGTVMVRRSRRTVGA